MALANRHIRSGANRPAPERKDVYEQVTERLIAALEQGTVPWARPWLPGSRPRSMSTRKAYQGINTLLLSLTAQERGYRSPWWGTFRQIQELGGHVRKGEHGTHVVLVKTFDKTEVNDLGEKVEKRVPLLRMFTVFNGEQADELPERFGPAEGRENEAIEDPEEVLRRYLANGGPQFFTDVEGQAYYIPSFDQIHVPPMSSFKSSAHAYYTYFHEASHSTGHVSRLNRKESEEFSHGDTAKETYAREELVAEMSAAMLLTASGIGTDELIENNAAYVASWLRHLRNDKKLVVQAASAAGKAAEWVLDDPEAQLVQAEVAKDRELELA